MAFDDIYLTCTVCTYGTNSERKSAQHERETGHLMQEEES